MFNLHIHIPYYITLLILLYPIFMSTIGINGAHRFGYAIGTRIVEGIFIAVLGFLFPNVSMGSLPGINLIFHPTMSIMQLAIVWTVLGVVLSSICWFFKHDFSAAPKTDVVYVKAKEEPRPINVTINHQVVSSSDSDTAAANLEQAISGGQADGQNNTAK